MAKIPQKVKKTPWSKDQRIDHQSFYSDFCWLIAGFITPPASNQGEQGSNALPSSLWPWSWIPWWYPAIQELRERQKPASNLSRMIAVNTAIVMGSDQEIRSMKSS